MEEGGKEGEEGKGEDGWRGDVERAMGSCGNERVFEFALGEVVGEDEDEEARSFLEGVELFWPMVVR